MAGMQQWWPLSVMCTWHADIFSWLKKGWGYTSVTLHCITYFTCLMTLDDLHLPDNFWCFTFQRAVKGYVHHKSNCKNIELSFVKAECRRELHMVSQLLPPNHPQVDRTVSSEIGSYIICLSIECIVHHVCPCTKYYYTIRLPTFICMHIHLCMKCNDYSGNFLHSKLRTPL